MDGNEDDTESISPERSRTGKDRDLVNHQQNEGSLFCDYRWDYSGLEFVSPNLKAALHNISSCEGVHLIFRSAHVASP